MAKQFGNRLRRRGISILAFTLAGLLLASCGPIGNDDDPTPTAESMSQPTDAATSGATDTAGETVTAESDVTQETVGAATTMPVDAASPSATEIDEATTPAQVVSISTPVDEATQTSASPVASDLTPSDATPVAENTPISGVVFSGDDGTSGATPPSAAQGTPGGLLVAVDNTPESSVPAGASPQASPVADQGEEVLLADVPAALVTSCEPEVVPVIPLSNVVYSTVSDVNIRIGPGVDCDPLAISPIGEFQLITLTGGPVTRDGEDFVWVQVTAASGETGWIVTDGIEPVE